MSIRELVTVGALMFASSMQASQSIPYPTPLQALATHPEARILWTEEVARIETPEAATVITALEVENPDEESPARGILVELESAGAEDEFFVDSADIKQFMNELAGLEPLISKSYSGEPCGAKHSCISGIARCRPSQHIPQAYCPEVRTFTAGGQALILRTPEIYFEFPDVPPSAMLAAVYLAWQRIASRAETEAALTE